MLHNLPEALFGTRDGADAAMRLVAHDWHHDSD